MGCSVMTRADEGATATWSRVGAVDRSHGGTTHFGVLCRTCQELVAFDVCPYVSLGPGAASMHPGAIRCGLGHAHIYFPRDFQFISRAVAVSPSTMKENRERYLAINPRLPVLSSHRGWNVSAAEGNGKRGDSPRRLVENEAPPAYSGPDPRREAAQKAAKERWSNWADKKAPTPVSGE